MKFEKKVKALRVMLSDLEKRSAAEEVFARLEKTAAFILADRILMYHSLPDEVFTHDFLSKWHGRKHFFLPRVNGVNLDILPYEESRLELGSFHIEEPSGDNVVDPSEIELIVVLKPSRMIERATASDVGKVSTTVFSAPPRPRKSA